MTRVNTKGVLRSSLSINYDLSLFRNILPIYIRQKAETIVD